MISTTYEIYKDPSVRRICKKAENKISKNEMAGTCGTDEWIKNLENILLGNPGGMCAAKN